MGQQRRFGCVTVASGHSVISANPCRTISPRWQESAASTDPCAEESLFLSVARPRGSMRRLQSIARPSRTRGDLDAEATVLDLLEARLPEMEAEVQHGPAGPRRGPSRLRAVAWRSLLRRLYLAACLAGLLRVVPLFAASSLPSSSSDNGLRRRTMSGV